MLKAVLFDLDDTLIDWSQVENDWEERDEIYSRGVFDYVCSEVQPLEDFDGFLKAFRRSLRSAWEHGRGSLRSPHLGRVLNDTLEAVGVPAGQIDQTACLEAYGWTAAPGLVPFPDVPPLLQLLCDQGVRIGIVTNAHMPMWLRDRELELLGILDFFPDCRFSAADVGYLKPHPNIFKLALECVDAAPEEAVFIGDNPIADVAGAQGAGLKAVLRTRTVGTSLLSGIIAPDSALDSLDGLPTLLDDWYPGWR